MRKIILVIGSSESDKAKFVQQYIDVVPDYFVARVNGNIYPPQHLNFDTIQETTDLLIVDDLPTAKHLNLFYSFVNGIDINKPGERSFNINPQIIITSSLIKQDQLRTDASFTERFVVVDIHSLKHF